MIVTNAGVGEGRGVAAVELVGQPDTRPRDAAVRRSLDGLERPGGFCGGRVPRGLADGGWSASGAKLSFCHSAWFQPFSCALVKSCFRDVVARC